MRFMTRLTERRKVPRRGTFLAGRVLINLSEIATLDAVVLEETLGQLHLA